MPFYTYKCPRCDAEREEMRPMDDRNKDRPVCENGDASHYVGQPGGLPAGPVPCVMDLVIAPVPGIVRNPAAGPRRSSS